MSKGTLGLKYALSVRSCVCYLSVFKAGVHT